MRLTLPSNNKFYSSYKDHKHLCNKVFLFWGRKMKFLKHYLWFIKESARFLDCNFTQFVAKGGLSKAYKHARFMVKWEKLTHEQREKWYLSGEGRILEF